MKPYDDQGVFGPETMRVLERAKESACKELQTSRDVTSSDEQEIAKRVLEQAKAGERSIDRLVKGALQALSLRR